MRTGFAKNSSSSGTSTASSSPLSSSSSSSSSSLLAATAAPPVVCSFACTAPQPPNRLSRRPVGPNPNPNPERKEGFSDPGCSALPLRCDACLDLRAHLQTAPNGGVIVTPWVSKPLPVASESRAWRLNQTHLTALALPPPRPQKRRVPVPASCTCSRRRHRPGTACVWFVCFSGQTPTHPNTNESRQQLDQTCMRCGPRSKCVPQHQAPCQAKVHKPPPKSPR
jgi:hypothetical protein